MKMYMWAQLVNSGSNFAI